MAEDTIGENGASQGAAADDEGLPSGSTRRVEAIQLRLLPVATQGYPAAIALPSLALVVAAVQGWLWLAVPALAVAVLVDWVLTHPNVGTLDWIRRAGAGMRTRALVRSLAMAVTFGVGADHTTLQLYALTAVVVHGAWVLFSTMVSTVISTQPAMGITGIGQSLELRYFYSRARRRRAAGGFILLALEWLGAVGLWLTAPAGEHVVLAAVVVAVVCAAALGFAALSVIWRRRFARSGRVERYEEQLLAELEAFAPEVIVYMTAAAKGQSSYILNQWLPAFDRMPRPGVIVVRESHNVTPITQTTLPILYAPKTRDVERFVVPSAKLALYPANGGRNVHLVREAGLRHIFLNHGDSDKATSANPVSRLYDEVWVAGEAAVDRYELAGIEIPRERFKIVGRPQVDALPVGKRTESEGPRVLYAPTFEGHYEEVNYSSLEYMGPQMIRKILAERPDIGIIFKPHPYTGMERKGMGAARLEVMRLLRESPNAGRHMIAEDNPRTTLNDCLEIADVLISDISSVVTDFLHTERPIMTSNPKGLSHEDFKVAFPTQAASYIVDPDLATFMTDLDAALGDDPLYAERLQMKRYVLGDLPAGPLQAFCDQIDRSYDDAVEKLSRVRNQFKWSEEQVKARPRV